MQKFEKKSMKERFMPCVVLAGLTAVTGFTAKKLYKAADKAKANGKNGKANFLDTLGNATTALALMTGAATVGALGAGIKNTQKPTKEYAEAVCKITREADEKSKIAAANFAIELMNIENEANAKLDQL